MAVEGELEQGAEQERADDDAGEQLADDAGDFDPLGEPAEQLGGDEHRGELEEDEHHR